MGNDLPGLLVDLVPASPKFSSHSEPFGPTESDCELTEMTALFANQICVWQMSPTVSHGSGAIMRLHYDILSLVTELLSRNALLQVLLTCKTLHKLGIAALLRDVEIPSRRTLALFSKYMQQNPLRFELLRSLRFSIPHPVEEDRVQFLDLLKRTTRLRVLELTNSFRLYPARTLWNSPAPDSAVAPEEILSLTTLHTLVLYGYIHERSLKYSIPNAQWKLRVLDLREAGSPELLPALSALSTTLEELHCNFYRSPEANPEQTLTALRWLHLYNAVNLDVDILAQYFPNVTRFTVDRVFTESSLTFGITRQLARPWPELSIVEGPPVFLSTLGRGPPVSELRLTRVKSDSGGILDDGTLAAILQDVMPTELSLTLEIWSNYGDLHSIFEAVGGSIRRLDITVSYAESEWTSSTELLVGNMLYLAYLDLYRLFLVSADCHFEASVAHAVASHNIVMPD